ncbi:protein MAIN-LIKE 2-like isoform X2 [Lotus japonicus]|uniref:protein MAIN-LIKE 2-like isoform X2 n=1 Tax=Lotus japonicus TaxID=34305 RepID=UPI0025838CC1|nr:protein MAIN-LIKE 2-like isoform X2 [Lotus japonicus]
MAYKGSGKLDTLASLYAKLEEKDSVFKRKIDLIISNNGPDIACGQEPDDRRIYAILLIVIVSIVAPTGDGHVCRSSYVQFIKNLDDVNNYAWGAALLSFLYRGMRRYKTEEKKFVDGNTWVLLSFMLFHIPKLQQELQIDLTVQPPTPLLFSVVNSLEKIGRDHYSRYVPKVTALLNSLDATDIKWHPYTREMLPAMVQEQISFTTRLSPLFCLNYVEHHLPHLLAPDSPLTCACTHMGMCIVGDLEYMFVVCSYLACHWRHLVSCHYRIVLHFFGTD